MRGVEGGTVENRLSSHNTIEAKHHHQKPLSAFDTTSNNAHHTEHNETTITPLSLSPSPFNHPQSRPCHPSTPPFTSPFPFRERGSTSESPQPDYTSSQSRIMRMKGESCRGCGCSLFLCFEVALAVSLVFDEEFGCWRPMITIFATLDIQ